MINKGKTVALQAPRGMHDILPADQKYWERIRRAVREVAAFYNFERIDTPIVEAAELFVRSVGEDTDIVSKEMYSFKTKGGDDLTLRPEGTAGVVRAYLERGMASLPQPVKLYYLGPMFRHESPQRGRYRQLWQFGFEVIGETDPVIDAQIMQLITVVAAEVGLKNLTVKINSIGCLECRAAYRKALAQHYRPKAAKLCKDCRRRIKTNVLRLLDCKHESCAELRQTAPHGVDHLCSACHSHFRAVLEFLDELSVSYDLDPFLVRGLDYYTKTVFEIFPEESGPAPEGVAVSAALALGGGGRYDDLVELLGGKPTPAVGAACGMERWVELMQALEVRIPERNRPRVFLAQLGELAKKKSLKLLEDFRKAGVQIAESLGRESIKSQLRSAARLGVEFTLIMGQKETLDGTIIIREMNSGMQELVALEKVVAETKRRLAASRPVGIVRPPLPATDRDEA